MAPFVFGMLGALVIVSFGNMLKAINLSFEGRVPRAIIVEWFFKRTPEDMQFIFPVAMLLSSLMVFGGMSRTSELVALQAAGVSLVRLAVPVLIFSLTITVGLFLFLDRVVPPSMRRSQELWEKHILADQATASFRKDLLLRTGPNRLVFVGRFNTITNEIEYLKIRDYSPDGKQFLKEFSAKKGVYRGGNLWDLYGLVIMTPTPVGDFRTVVQPMQTMPIGEGPDDLAQKERSPQEMNCVTLLERIRKLEEQGFANTLPLKVELYQKVSFPFCVTLFAVIGMAMGVSNPRSGGFVGFGISLCLTFLYYICMSLAGSLGKTGVLAPLLASWVHNVAFGFLAIGLVLRIQSR